MSPPDSAFKLFGVLNEEVKKGESEQDVAVVTD
jgi:hypothetical protein